MRKIPTLFVRNFDTNPRYVTRDITPGCEWVIEGEGSPTRMYDGTCVMFDGERWWARREVKEGKTAPDGFVALGADPETGKVMGYEPAGQSAFAIHHAEALVNGENVAEDRWGAAAPPEWTTGTYELLGPKVNGNPERFIVHELIRHDFAEKLPGVPRDFDGLAAWLHAHPYEGIVWHHEDSRMAKLKKRDFPVPGAG
jgi:hypothetical protein